MKVMIVVALALVAVAVALPVAPVAPVALVLEAESPKIIRSDYSQQPDGGYVFSYETENGISRNENGELKEALDEENKPHVVVIVRGSYSYTDKDGKVETINYIADENGFHPEGDSIPKVAAARR
ncbi:larval cuticle protein 1-like [Battus philenor]|uniref:larval cuticle protein 1-like n=1 Tax=Battus philenor TaxID=42288 RepID=UPI0035CEB118